MRRFIVVLSVLFAALALAYAFRSGIARIVDANVNGTGDASSKAVSANAVELHPRLWIADLHCDAALWDRDLLARSTRGHVDLPRLRDGYVSLQVFSFPNAFPLFSNYRRTPSFPDVMGLAAVAFDWPRRAVSNPVSRVLVQAGSVADAIVRSNGDLSLVTGVAQLAAAGREDSTRSTVLAIFAVEGLHIGENDLDQIDRMYTAGVRIFGLTHMSDNTVAGSAHGWRKHGLTEFGRRVVARIDSLGGIVDLAHASEATIDDVLAVATVPVLVSHTGVDGTCPGERNLSDSQLQRIAARGGVIGIGYWRGATCGDDAAAIARAMRHTADVAGIDAVALGSDFDGAVRTPFDASGLVYLTDALMQEGFDTLAIARIMGLNVRDFLLRSLPSE